MTLVIHNLPIVTNKKFLLPIEGIKNAVLSTSPSLVGKLQIQVGLLA